MKTEVTSTGISEVRQPKDVLNTSVLVIEYVYNADIAEEKVAENRDAFRRIARALKNAEIKRIAKF